MRHELGSTRLAEIDWSRDSLYIDNRETWKLRQPGQGQLIFLTF